MTRKKQVTEDGRTITRCSKEWKDTIHFNDNNKLICKIRPFAPVASTIRDEVTCTKCLFELNKRDLNE